MKQARTIALVVLALGAALLLGACGLETYLYLEAPGNYTTSPGTTLIFQHNTDNTNVNFLGYEVYYRLYPGKSDGSVPEQAKTDIAIIAGKISAATGADQVISTLTDKSFTKMSKGSSPSILTPGNPPFTSIASADTAKTGIQTFIELGSGQVTYKVPSSADEIWYCARSVNIGSSYLNFSDFTYSSQDCYPSSTLDDTDYFSSGRMLHPYLVAYAFAYALEPDFTATYSYPTLLNYSGLPTDISDIAN